MFFFNFLMKTIIAVWNIAKRGKSKTLRSFADLIMGMTPRVITDEFYSTGTGDFRLIIEFRGKVIAIESIGDPGTNLQIRLHEIVTKYNPDIIICTTRTSGATCRAVVAYENTYDIIWSSTYQYQNNTSIESVLNQAKAKNLFDLLVTLGRL